MTTNEPWREAARKVGATVLARRVELGYRTRNEFAKATGLTIKTLGEIERGVRPTYSRSTYALIEQTLGWATGYLERKLGALPDPVAARTGPEWEYQSGTCDVWQVAHLCNHMAAHGWEPVQVFDAHYDDAKVHRTAGDESSDMCRALRKTGVLFRRPSDWGADEDE